MTDDHTEEALRRALHDAASRVNVPMGTLPVPAPEPSRAARRRSDLRVPAIVTLVLVIVAGSIALIATRNGSDPASITVSGAAGDAITSDNADIQVFMSVAATDDQVESVRSALESSSDVAAYTFLSKEDSYQEFRAMYVCKPDLVGSISAADLPAGFRLRLTDAALAQSIARDLASQPGVKQVQVNPNAATAPTVGDATSTTSTPSTTGTPSPTVVVVSPTTTTVAGATGDEATTTTSPTGPSTSSDATTTTVPAESTTTTAPTSKEIPFVAPAPADCTTTTTGRVVPTVPNQTAATLPPAGEQPTDPTSAEQTVRDMWNRAFSATTPDAERYALYENYATHPELYANGLPQNQQYRDNLSVKVLDIVFVGPTQAAVRYQLDFPALHLTEPADIGHAVLTDEGWKVSTDTMCGLLAKGGRQCPAS